MKDLLIIGAGPVGLYAWSCAGLMGLSGYIIEGNSVPGGQPAELFPDKAIYDLPGIDKITGQDFVNNLLAKTEKYCGKITLLLETKVVELTEINDGFAVKLTNNTVIKVKTILITTGNGVFTPIKLEQLDSSFTYQNLTYQITNPTQYHNKTIAILGGGDSALDWANHFVEEKITPHVTIVHRREHYRAKDSSVEKLKQNQIKEYKNYHIEAITTNGDLITEMNLIHNADNSLIPLRADYYLVQYGAKIMPSIISQWPLTFTRTNKIIISPSGQTSHPRIFAAGNIATYEGKYYNMATGFGESINALYNITKIIHGEKYHPGYLGADLT
ncbi:NAD(P)/FAD-dependent oxidoreductase [Spiroplasma chrysopicola]|uniref:Ferredoxin--NADP reductase n=1 Tax=Spiroplasma chrysopicola DF-1 TaxID=1276227 RepID=R4U1S6_9MOLU|nr:NAD(P)/FAD-dependent oxidoreductase [Spiroplasma chrysopicola]AGM25277.1 thioredoxin reductase [Spiroplasma chrysopicola DF-1]